MKILRRLPLLALVLLLPLLLGGCKAVLPRTAALQSVHEAYRDEFTKFVMIDPNKALTATAPEHGDFDVTLRRIRDFRASYGEDSPEEAHLTVLEGMIYLQTGRIGMASLISQDVSQKAAKLSSGTGQEVRDKLFAESFKFLVEGWGEIAEQNDGDDQLADWSKLREAAVGIETKLNDTNRFKFASAEVDAGGVYLAATAGTFNVWAAQRAREQHQPNADQSRTNWYRESFFVIGRFLGPTERKAAHDESIQKDASPDSLARLRYLYWYAWFGKELNWPASP